MEHPDKHIHDAIQAIKDRGGLVVCRVNNFELEIVPNKKIGTFYRGDCYVVISASVGKAKGRQAARNGSAPLEWFIHVYQGPNSTQDERGTSAIKTVELDDYLGGKAVQSIENPDALSPRFKGLFPNILLKDGGHKSGMTHYSKMDEPVSLFVVKGKRDPVLNEVPCRTSSLDSNDCYIIDLERRLGLVYVIHGKCCNKSEARKAIQCASNFIGKVEVLDEREINDRDEHTKNIKKALGLNEKRDIKFEHVSQESDDDYEKKRKGKSLYRVHDDVFSEVPIKHSSLDSGDCFVLLTSTRLYVWKGNGSTKDEKQNALNIAREFIAEHGLSLNTPIIALHEHLETVDFKACFPDWEECTQTAVDFSKPVGSGSNVAKSVHTVIDFRTLYDKPRAQKRDELVDDDLDNGQGKTEIYRIDKDHPSSCEPEDDLRPFGKFVSFNSSDCYVIVYTFRSKRANKKERTIIYYWLGNDCDELEPGQAAVTASFLDKSRFDGNAIQIRVLEAKEPAYFMKIFGGYIMVEQEHKSNNGNARLFHVRGKEGNIRVVEVNVDASNLDTNDCFVLKTNRKRVYIWLGKGSLGDEQRIAQEAAEAIFKSDGCDFIKVEEGKSEPDEFWATLGGKKQYNVTQFDLDSKDKKIVPEREPRLFRLFNIRGSLEGEEIYDFVQDDLDSDDVFILDTYKTVYLWIGKDCREDEKNDAIRNLQKFIYEDDTCRNSHSDVFIMTIRQGYEPEDFKDMFGIWEEHRAEKMSLEDMKRLRIEENKKVPAMKRDNIARTYPRDVLTKTQEDLPDDVDPASKEMYLSDEEFYSVFKMERKEFDLLPDWKQKELKKEVNLF